MRILIVGGNGTIGRAISDWFSQEHEVLVAGRTSGDLIVDIGEPASIREMYAKAGTLDAVVCAAGEAKWDRFGALSDADYEIGLRSKLMGQVNLVRYGHEAVAEGGSFTLTTGILGDRPVPMTTSAAMVNGAVNSFVMAAALEMPRKQRINVVSAGLVDASAEKYADYFPGHTPVPLKKWCNTTSKL